MIEMDAAAVNSRKPGASDLLLAHCSALDVDRDRPAAKLRLEALVGSELARKLLLALCSNRAPV